MRARTKINDGYSSIISQYDCKRRILLKEIAQVTKYYARKGKDLILGKLLTIALIEGGLQILI